jgi:F-type H+-transporting ATPase subunit b
MATEVQTGTQAPAGGGGGLPQFDSTWWAGEFVWFCIIFAVVFALMAKVFVPRLGGTIDARDDKIAGDISQARKLKEQAEAQAAEADAEMAQARGRAQKLAAEAKARVQAEAASRQAAEEARLAATLAEAEAAIRASREQAMGHVQEIAADTAKAIVEKLTGQPASAQDVARALAHRI